MPSRVAFRAASMCSVSFHHRHIDDRVLCESHLRSARRICANGLHAQSVRQDRVMPYLVHRSGRQLQARRKLPDLVSQIGEADELVRRHPVLHLVAEMLSMTYAQ